MGKYSHLDLPRIISTEPEKQTRVDIKKREFLKNLAVPPKAAIFAAAYAEIRRAKDKLKAELKVLEIEVEAIKQLLIDQYDAEDMVSLKLGNGDAVRIQSEPYLVVENPPRFREWCVKDGLEKSLQLPWSTANSMVKALLLKGKPEPEGTHSFMLTKAIFSPGDKQHSDREDEDEGNT